MHSRTRNLLDALADKDADEILEALRGGGLTEADLVDRIATDKRTTGRRLKRLVDLEILSSTTREGSAGRSGPRPKVYEVSDQAIFQFCDAADAFGLALSEGQTKRYRDHVASKRQKNVTASSSKDAAKEDKAPDPGRAGKRGDRGGAAP